MPRRTSILLVTIAALDTLSVSCGAATNGRRAASPARPVVADSLDVAPVWAGHPVGFALLTQGDRQFVAFYDAQRRLTVAQRRLQQREWGFAKLPVTTGWDSHNYITMAVDDDGCLHLTGDMHADELKYYRTSRPLDATSFAPATMVGCDEQRITYPRFLRGPEHRLLFTYRDGSSGSGDQILNVYDHPSREWKRFLDTPLIDGEGKRNAYLEGPVKGPDGFYHLAWVWRDTPDARTNHDLSYARSKDLRLWETSDGTELPLPIRWGDAEVVDPVPTGGGLINGNVKIGFDVQGRVTVSYHKYDQEGHTQPFNARLENGRWVPHHITDWPYRCEVSGRGSLGFPIGLGPVGQGTDGQIRQTFRHPEFGSGEWLIDPETLRAVGRARRRQHFPRELARPQGEFPGLRVRWSRDLGESSTPPVRYVLRWETLGPNRDRPRAEPLPPPSLLRVYAITSESE
jgi:hypothetical protein